MKDIEWLLNHPDVEGLLVCHNPADGGYACFVEQRDTRNFLKRFFEPYRPIEGGGDTPEEAVRHARMQVQYHPMKVVMSIA